MVLDIDGNKIPTKEYIDDKLKTIENAFNDHVNNVDDYHSVESLSNDQNNLSIDTKEDDVKTIDLENNKSMNIDASNINTDKKHRFITDEKLDAISKCATKYEVKSELEELSNNLKQNINSNYDNILNMKNASNALKVLNQLLNDDEESKNLLELLSSKIGAEEFNKHISSCHHITDDDREALDNLHKYIKNTKVDWNASETDINCILNKPEALKADGGDADTVKGYEISDLLNISEYGVVVGIHSNNYKKSNVNVFINRKDDSNEIINKVLEDNKHCQIKFREGVYYVDSLELLYNDIIGSGVDNTIFDFVSNDAVHTIKIKNSYLENLTISNASIVIYSNNKILNCAFKNCDIFIKNCDMTTIKNCTFNNGCSLIYTGMSNTNNIFTENIVYRPMSFDYTGGNNIITNNIYI